MVQLFTSEHASSNSSSNSGAPGGSNAACHHSYCPPAFFVTAATASVNACCATLAGASPWEEEGGGAVPRGEAREEAGALPWGEEREEASMSPGSLVGCVAILSDWLDMQVAGGLQHPFHPSQTSPAPPPADSTPSSVSAHSPSADTPPPTSTQSPSADSAPPTSTHSPNTGSSPPSGHGLTLLLQRAPHVARVLSAALQHMRAAAVNGDSCGADPVVWCQALWLAHCLPSRGSNTSSSSDSNSNAISSGSSNSNTSSSSSMSEDAPATTSPLLWFSSSSQWELAHPASLAAHFRTTPELAAIVLGRLSVVRG